MSKLAMALLLLLVSFAPLPAQTVGTSIGVYFRGPGEHPFVFSAFSLRAEYKGIAVDFLHAPVRINGTATDLFAYRLLTKRELLKGSVRPFLLAGIGWHQWRKWVCLEDSCGAVSGPNYLRFKYFKGPVITVGGGVKLKLPGALWQRVDVQYLKTEYGGSDIVFSLGIDIDL